MPIDEAARQRARLALTDAVLLVADEATWTRVDKTLDALLAALAAEAGRAFATATASLLTIGLRAKKAGTAPTTPPPPPVRERLNETIHQLGERPTQSDQEATPS